MATTELTKPGLSADEQREIEDIKCDVRTLKKAMVYKVAELGQKLQRAHQLCEREAGGFIAFLKEVEIGKTVAYRAMQVWEKFGECPTLGQIEASAAFILAYDSTPEAARKEAIKRTEAGEKVTVKAAEKIIEEIKPARATTSQPKPVEPESCDDDELENDQGDVTEPCPNCGGVDFDEDGDCTTCYEPADHSVDADEMVEPEPRRIICLPSDLDEAIEALKLCLMRHKFAKWKQIPSEDARDAVLYALDVIDAPSE